MIGGVSGELQAEISLDRGADVGRASDVDTPTAIFILMADNPVGGALKPLGVAGAEQGVEQNVIGFKRGIGFEFAAPVAIVVLGGEKKLASGGDGGADTAEEAVDFTETKLRRGS